MTGFIGTKRQERLKKWIRLLIKKNISNMAFKMKGNPMKRNFGMSSMKKEEETKEKKYKPSDPQSDEFWEPGGMHQIMTKRGYKWDGTNFVKK